MLAADYRILVTGAAGFIGSHVCEQLLMAGYKVSGIDNFDSFYPRHYKERNLTSFIHHPDFEFIEGDFGSEKDLMQLQELPAVVVHLAARAGVLPSLQAPSKYIHTNIVLTNSLLEWMRKKEIRKLVFASSSSVYGNTKSIPFHETQNVDFPVSPYAFSKRTCELMNYTYHDIYGMDVINLRFFTVYGERQRPDLAIHKFLDRILHDQPVVLYGDGSTSRDYTYWNDTTAGVLGAVKYILTHKKVYEIINLGNSAPVKLIELVNTMAEILGVQPKLVFEEKKAGDVDATYADINKARKLLGYNPETELVVGLEKFINWYRLQQTVA
jgi:UDP-glucuronate 4-epimerase